MGKDFLLMAFVVKQMDCKRKNIYLRRVNSLTLLEIAEIMEV